MRLFHDNLGGENDIMSLLKVMCDCAEYDELPVRHNEDKVNAELAAEVKWAVDARSMDDPHSKAFLLLQAHFSRMSLPISDYITDTKSVLDQSVRILQAMVDVCADGGWLFTTLNCMNILQMVIQACWNNDSTLFNLPHVNMELVMALHQVGVDCLPELLAIDEKALKSVLQTQLHERHINEFLRVMATLPLIDVKHFMAEPISPMEEVQLKVDLNRASKFPHGGVYAPFFPKKKDEGWWLVLGDATTGELLALRRVTFTKSTSTTLTFDAPAEPGKYTYTLYVMCDSHVGMDQQYDINFTVTEGF